MNNLERKIVIFHHKLSNEIFWKKILLKKRIREIKDNICSEIAYRFNLIYKPETGKFEKKRSINKNE